MAVPSVFGRNAEVQACVRICLDDFFPHLILSESFIAVDVGRESVGARDASLPGQMGGPWGRC